MTEQIARTPKQIGAAVRRRRRAMGMNQKDVGTKTQLAQAYFQEQEHANE